MLGNVAGCMYGIERAVEHRDELEAIAAWVVAVPSFCCALILRARVLKSSGGSEAGKAEAGKG